MRIATMFLVTTLFVNTWSVSPAMAQTPSVDSCTVTGNVIGDTSPTTPPIKGGVPLAEQGHGKPIAGAVITFRRSGTTRHVRTDKMGNFRATLAAGSYAVDVTATGFAPTHQDAMVQPSDSDDGGVCLDLGFGLGTVGAERARTQANARIARHNAALAQPYHAVRMPVTPALSAEVSEFHDSIASQTRGCDAMANMLNLEASPNRRPPTLGDEIVVWAMEANSAKVCASDTRDSSAERLPRLIHERACAHLKDHFDLVNATYRSQTSWACGWPAPIPSLRTVPGIMPYGYEP